LTEYTKKIPYKKERHFKLMGLLLEENITFSDNCAKLEKNPACRYSLLSENASRSTSNDSMTSLRLGVPSPATKWKPRKGA
jgi:hypothetical protein